MVVSFAGAPVRAGSELHRARPACAHASNAGAPDRHGQRL